MFKRISSTLILSVLIVLPATAAQSAKDLFCRGTYEFDEDRFGEAMTSFSQAIRLNPRHSNAYYYRGVIHHYQKRYPEAIANYNQALSIGTDQPVIVLKSRASALASLGDYKQALEDLKLANTYKPNDRDTERALAFTFLKLGSRKSAIAILEKMTARYFQSGNGDFYLLSRDELQKVRSGRMLDYRWSFSMGGSEFEKECP
ncbi:tetratricopeptide repeat protein [Aerosakkonemataceae cyanobacterium BLCC-F50]|uniref:Tetratricopeptide repeat protein n=1 Tax=Floridaenema flaviceps BLCC-F50 TaxID=3153642 RepID=A0ABV4Y5B7_9CYAN